MTIESAVASGIPVPEPDLTPAQLIARAEALQPRLRAAQAETEARGYYAKELHDALVQAGCYRALQPRRFGGYEFDIPTFSRMVIAIARGDPSVGWCLALGAGHALVVGANYSERAQAEIFGLFNGHFQAPHRAAPEGTAVPMDGGYRIKGTFRYCSGIPFATHLMGTCRLMRADGTPVGVGETAQNVVAVVPSGQFTMLDDWGSMIGMKGSGSNSGVVDDAWIPADLVANWDAIDRAQGTPGTRLHGNPMYLGYIGFHYPAEVAAVSIGTAKAALDEFTAILTSKRVEDRQDPSQAMLRSESAANQRHLGEAIALIDAGEALVLHAGEQYMEYAHAWATQGRPFTREDDLRLGAMVRHGDLMAMQAVELMFGSVGSAPLRDGERMNRYYRDISQRKRIQFADRGTNIGRLRLGLPPLPMNEFNG